MKNRMLEKAAKQKQITATWQATVRPAPTWIAEKGRPKYRPFVALVVDSESAVVCAITVQEQRPTASAFLSLLANAMTRPLIGSGGRYRPTRIVLDDRALADELAAPLAEIGIRCDYAASLPVIDEALRELAAHLNGDDDRPSIVATPGVTLPLLADFYEAAAHFYRAAPWRWVDNLSVIEIRYPADSDTVRYGVIMGFGGQEFGLAIYPTAQMVRQQYQDLAPAEIMRHVRAIALSYNEPDVLSFADLDAIEAHDWAVAGPKAYPLALKTVPPGDLKPLTTAELALLAAALRTLPDFVLQSHQTTAATLAAAEATYALTNVHANQQIAYLFPARIPELEKMRRAAQRDDEELEEMIAQWHWDEPSHAFARQVGALLLDFMNYLATQRLSESALRRYEKNAWLIGKFTCDAHRAELYTPALFAGPPAYLAEFRHEVGDSAVALNAYQATWRRLARFIREQGYLGPDA